jgi:molybdenum cofactor cytidylyltransferase
MRFIFIKIMVIPIVLAAGLSRRMGSENKLLLPFGDSTILGTTLGNILRGGFEQVLVVFGHESEQIKSSIELISNRYPTLTIVENRDFETGMTSSIKTAVRQLTTHNSKLITHFMVCLSDMPFLNPEDYQILAKGFEEKIKENPNTIMQPTFNSKRGNPTLLSHTYTQDILNLEFTEGCRPIVQANLENLYFVEMPTHACLRDIDTPEDFAKTKV